MSPRSHVIDPLAAKAVVLARSAAERAAGDFGVGEHKGVVADGVRIVTHFFECLHPGYRGWHWAVTLVRASRAKQPTVSEITLLPTNEALVAKEWVPWEERVQAGDIAPGVVMPSPDDDLRLDPGYGDSDLPADVDLKDRIQYRSLIQELGLARQRVLSKYGRDMAVTRWLEGDAGDHDAYSQSAPANCNTCGYFIALRGSLGELFGACANEYSPSDGRVVSLKHGCGGHSDVVMADQGIELGEPVFDTIGLDQSIFN